MKLDFSCTRLRIEGTFLVFPCNDHLAILLRLITWIYTDNIGRRIIRKRTVRHGNVEILCIIFVNLLVIFSVVQSGLHIHVLHLEIFIRDLNRLNLPLHINLGNLILGISKIQYIFQNTYLIKWPLIFVKCRIIGKCIGQCLCLELHFQINTDFQIHSSHSTAASSCRCRILQFVVEVTPDLCITAHIRRDTDTGDGR